MPQQNLLHLQPMATPTPLSLKRLLSKPDVQQVLRQLVDTLATPIVVLDPTGQPLLGTHQPGLEQFPIKLEGQTIGWVAGAAAIASLLSYLASKELERRVLAQETLDRYREICLIYDISEKIAANLELEGVAELVLHETRKQIPGSSGLMMVYSAELQQYESIAQLGQGFATLSVAPGQGILGTVLASGTGEIVNQVEADERSTPAEAHFCSLIVAPLKTQNRVMGLLCLGSETCVTYTAADLKRLNSLAAHSASVIDNAILHQNKLRQERIKSHLERYVPSQVVDAILATKGDVLLEPVRKDVTVLFSDIRNFTTQCEALPPETIVSYLNEYFTHMVEEIFSHQGTVNKFVGDMIVALFGAPTQLDQSEKRAIETAIAMQRRIQTIPIDWIRQNFNTGIGISSGKVVVGNIGSPRHIDYTAIGDEVNTAARLQAIAQGGQILVSRRVYDATRQDFEFRSVGTLAVKGKRQSVDVFEVIGF